ncbi:MAG: amidohydrolase family protein [Firmicutes bacterium]|nr:amidohydrolase family protein [Bacillota bacterium]
MANTLLIQNGRVVDPIQGLDAVCNVYIEDGKISAITAETPNADVVIDAAGKIVSPGFIDIHMHEDLYDEKNDRILTSMSTSALKMGVTLDIAGNCGDNFYDPSLFLDITDRDGAPVNIGLLVGHTWLRNLGQRHDKYKPIDQAAIEQMAKVCQTHLDNGCLGVSFGVKYIPGTTWEEITALSKLCRPKDKLVASHVRADVDGVFDACQELARMGREAHVKVEFSHIGSMGGYGQMEKLLEQIDGYRREGIQMTCDCYPYNAFSTGIGETTYDDGFLESYQSDYDSILIVNGKYAGQRCTKAIFDELRREAPDTGTVGYFMKAEDVAMALTRDFVMIGSDGVRNDGMGHPRASGSFARFISDYIRTSKVSLSEGVRKMSTMAAQLLNLPYKGNLLVGSDADITIFTLDEVEDLATYENGQIPPKGFDYVLIGGEIALKDGQVVNGHLGRSVRR